MTQTPSQTVIDALALPMPALLGTVNAYLIYGKKGAALVDCGLFDATSRKDFGAALLERGLRFEDIETVFLTHQHVDHAGAARFFQELGAEVIMSQKDADFLAEYYDRPDLDESRALFSGLHGLPDAFRDQVRAVFGFLRSMGQKVIPNRLVDDGDTVLLAGLPFDVLAVPGHTPGHLCLFSRSLHVAFTGDCVISPRATYISSVPTDDDENADPYLDFRRSLQRLSALTGVLPLSGHGAHQKPLNIAAPKIIGHLEGELAALKARLSVVPSSAFDLCRPVMESRPRAFPRWLAVSQTVAYLTHLTRNNEAEAVETEHGLLFRRR